MAEQNWDVVIIGGGPAGTRTASGVSRRGLSTLILEKRERIGEPVRCAEAIGPAGAAQRLLDLDERWISSRVDGLSVVAPGGRAFEESRGGIGYVLDRRAFDLALAGKAEGDGATLRTGHQVTGLVEEDGAVRGVEVLDLSSGRTYTTKSRVTVGADGVEALSSRWAGLRGSVGVSGMFSCAQYTVSGIDMERRFAEFHLGSSLAPGGYAWVFPKGPSSANVGVGIDAARAGGVNASGYLDRFIRHRCPGCRKGRFVAGGTLVGGGLATMVAGGFLAVGEAAGQNDPFTGGGILESIRGADMAAETIATAFETGDFTASGLRAYDRHWWKVAGRSNAWLRRAASVFYSLEDAELDRLLTKLSREKDLITGAGISPLRLIKVILLSTPRPIVAAALGGWKKKDVTRLNAAS